jgi:hypothetical protein
VEGKKEIFVEKIFRDGGIFGNLCGAYDLHVTLTRLKSFQLRDSSMLEFSRVSRMSKTNKFFVETFAMFLDNRKSAPSFNFCVIFITLFKLDATKPEKK